ncbi:MULTISPECIES: hypothetical protein [unclassified Paracoccus (in: a-proteobacteria)]|uniref:hypothetical protein n=1 Tax=unclassified Paracoccus (in: a-proteobacteria) TaxID=2688777 RepID=UPI0012B33334|nr:MULTISPECIES: hypothetical protein [unclassified Paracoccus (in: a-proteobacteria)]UXU76089.1 hypothetical protein GB879_006325 [Paracoccus sp. SMMA_5]UXU82001.1 hypothetical protein GB880_006310 [Paracoccus sp. SMMA_5_TC]
MGLRLWMLVLALMLASAATAGPWGRDPGSGFLSATVEGDRAGYGSKSLYAEYGVSPRRLLGLELGHSRTGESNLLLWWQQQLDAGDGPDRWTVSLGGGLLRRDGALMPLVQIGTAWGRGLDAVPGLRHLPGGGWVAIETRLKLAGKFREVDALSLHAGETSGFLDHVTAETSAKAQATLGWNARDGLSLIQQLRLEKRDDADFSSKLAASVVQELGMNTRLEVGMVQPLNRPEGRSLFLGTWFDF